MKTIALNLLKQALRMVGYKTILKFVWNKALYPELKKLVDRSEQGWDDELLKFVNDNIHKVIDQF